MRTRVQELFHAVADFSEDARSRFFAEQHIDEATRNEVEALLAYDSPVTTSLEHEIGQLAKQTIERFESQNLNCGPYKLGDLLGRGGMGAVYSAERVDGEVAQRVAVKLLRPGADDPRTRQRFFAERQILAELEHPNIARLLDAGHRDDGQPYLAMEYVEGKPIDVYTADFSIRQKIVLFIKVCSAVAYLHRNLVVHRDLKPANILVTKDGEPKLLDFGIAKILDLTADRTMTSLRMLTPDYASPDQVIGGPVTTATDIYSLGAVLYKLLTGEPPHHFDNDSVEAIASAICEGKIESPAKLAPALQRDLEMILMKALRREPEERYGSVEQFAEDLENYLQSRPVRARKGGAWYRARKFVRRYWIPVAASSLAIAGLAAGLALANRERRIAQRHFQDVRQLSNKLFDIDLEARKVPGNTKTRQMIVDTSLDYLRRLASDAKAEPELALELGNAYMRVARVQGVPISANLGQMDQAAGNLQTAEQLIESALKADPRNRTAMLRAAQINHDRMLLARFNRRYDDALALARKSAGWLEKFNAQPSDKGDMPQILNTYQNVADQYMLSEQYDDALRLCAHGIELAKSFEQPPYIGTFLWVSSDVYRRRGDLDEALKQVRESVRVLDPTEQAKRGAVEQGRWMNYIFALVHEGWVLGDDAISLGRYEEGEAVLERAFDLADTSVHRDLNDQNSRGRLAVAGLGAADILRRSDARRSLAMYDHVLQHAGEIANNPSFRRFEASALAGSTYPLRALGRTAEARQRLDTAFDRLKQVNTYPAEKVRPGGEADRALRALAEYEAGAKNFGKAAETCETLLRQMFAWSAKPETNLSDAVDISRVYALLAEYHRRAGNRDQASTFEAKRVSLWQHWDSKLPRNAFVSRQMTQ